MIIVRPRPLPVRVRVGVLEYALPLTRDLVHSWPRGPHQYYLCATPPSLLLIGYARVSIRAFLCLFLQEFECCVYSDRIRKEMSEFEWSRTFKLFRDFHHWFSFVPIVAAG